MKNELWFIVVFSHRARAESVRRRPRHSIARHHLSLALEKWRPLPNEKKIYVDCCLFLLVFPWLQPKKGAAQSCCVIVWCRWLCFRCNCCNCARLRKKAFFAAVHFCCHQPAAGVHVRIYLPAARARRAGAATRAHAESFGGWGVLLC